MMIVSITKITCAGFISVFEEMIFAIIVEPPAEEFPFITKASPSHIKIPPKI